MLRITNIRLVGIAASGHKCFSGDGSTAERLTLNQQIEVRPLFPVLARKGGTMKTT